MCMCIIFSMPVFYYTGSISIWFSVRQTEPAMGQYVLGVPKQTFWKFLHFFSASQLENFNILGAPSTNIRIQRCLKHRNPEICKDITQNTSQGNSNAPTKRLFLKKPVQLAPWARKKWVAREPTLTPTTTGTKRAKPRKKKEEREREREREWGRERERER